MSRNIIKVLWIDDDLGVYESFRNIAIVPPYNIQFIHADNWIDGKQKLKEEFNEISAIILDAQCKWDKQSIAEDRFLNDVMSELWELFGEVRRTIPWYVLSAGTMKKYAEAIETANSRKRQSYNKEWGPVSWKKVEILSQFVNNPLLSQICEVAKRQSHNIILSRHHDTFKYLGTEGYLSQAARPIMLNALSALYFPEENLGFEFQGNPIRKVIEHLFRHANKMGIIPDDFLNDRRKPQMTDCMRFLIGEHPNYIKIQLWDPDKEEPFAVFPKPHYYYIQNVLNYVHSCSHSEEDEDAPYIIDSGEKDLFFAITLQLSHLIAFYGKFINEHWDVEHNKTLHRTIPEEATEEVKGISDCSPEPAKRTVQQKLIPHIVEGYVEESDGVLHIADVWFKTQKKYKAVGKKFRIENVLLNTQKNKDKYPYFAPDSCIIAID